MQSALLVEPDMALRRRTAALLSERDFEVAEAEFGPDIVGTVSGSNPSILLIDTKVLRTSSAMELLQQVRAYAREMPILLVTDADTGPALETALALDGVDFIVKPFEAFELHHRMDRQLRGAKAKAAARRQGATRPAPVIQEVHDPQSGRLDAKRVAAYLDVPLKQLTPALGKKYTAVFKSPSSAALQPSLAPIAHTIEMLVRMLGGRRTALAWLNRPHPDLDKRTPLSVILDGHASAVETVLANAMDGIPS